jgi:hypothetical protein
MKKTLLFITSILLVVYSCKKNDVGDPTPIIKIQAGDSIVKKADTTKKADTVKVTQPVKTADTTKMADTTKITIVGVWYLTSDTLTYYSNGKAGYPFITNFDHSYYINFNSDGTGVQNGNGGNTKFTYSVAGDIATINYADQYSVGQLYPGYTKKPIIKRLDAHNLYLLYDDYVSHNTVEAVVCTR